MKHPERVEDYPGHVAQAIERATGYLQPSQDLEAFQKSQQVQDAVVRNIEIIDEAMNKVKLCYRTSLIDILCGAKFINFAPRAASAPNRVNQYTTLSRRRRIRDILHIRHE